MRKIEVEAEGSEIVIQNSAGDYAIIPKNKVREVEEMISSGCNSCIDAFVATLPTLKDYAQDGTTIPSPIAPPIVSADRYIPDALVSGLSYQERLQQYRNNPKSKGVPTLGAKGAWERPSPESYNLLKEYYENLPENEITNNTLEEYQSLLNNTFFVDRARKDDTIESLRSYTIYEPVDISAKYKIGTPATKSTQQLNTDSSGNLTFNLKMGSNPNAQTSLKVHYNTEEDRKKLEDEFKGIKTDVDYKPSRFNQITPLNQLHTTGTNPIKAF